MEKEFTMYAAGFVESSRFVVLSSRGDKDTNKHGHNSDKLVFIYNKKSHLTPSGIYTRGADIE
jgi:hypothetical protein